jgi:hypothetical protein
MRYELLEGEDGEPCDEVEDLPYESEVALELGKRFALDGLPGQCHVLDDDEVSKDTADVERLLNGSEIGGEGDGSLGGVGGMTDGRGF